MLELSQDYYKYFDNALIYSDNIIIDDTLFNI